MKKKALIPLSIILLGGGWLFFQWWSLWRFEVATDDAYAQSDIVPVAARVGGYVVELAVQDNQAVKKGDLLLRIDDRDYQAKADVARAQVELRRAATANLDARIAQQESVIRQAEAEIGAASAELSRSRKELSRTEELVRDSVASRQRQDLTQADAAKAASGVARTQAQAEAARRMLAVLKSEQDQNAALLRQAEASLAIAEIELAETIIKAPANGVIGNRAIRQGQLVRPGAQLLALVPLDHVWVEANFKETQLAHMKVGQKALITVDGLPGQKFSGQVESMSPASGAKFSLLPPENATGNFTKIVQRIPVRLAIDLPPEAKGRVRPGMSVVATVNIR